MKTPVVVTYSDNYKILYDNFVNSSKPLDLEIVTYKVGFGGRSEYGYESFAHWTSCYSKVANLLSFMNSSQAPVVIASDIDIQFFPNKGSLSELMLALNGKGLDWLGAAESSFWPERSFNNGFTIIKNTKATRNLITDVVGLLKTRQIMNDQLLVNQLIFDINYNIRYDFIPEDFIKFGHRPAVNKEKLLLHHAVQSGTIEDKITMLRRGKAEYLGVNYENVDLSTPLVRSLPAGNNT